jgi:hypothetical protein
MDILKPQDLKNLIETSDKWCVSFYMPTHPAGREQQQDPIRLKNLISRAEEQLVAYEVRRPDAKTLLQPAEDLLTDSNFWQHQAQGLAIFLSSNTVQVYRLPARFETLLVIARHFHIKPLLPLLSKNGQFYILALGLNQVRLLIATRHSVSEVDLIDVPTMTEALTLDDPESFTDFHTSNHNPSVPGSRPAIYNGQGIQSDEEQKTNVLRYFHKVDKQVNQFLAGDTTPMIAAGLDYLLPLYQEANTYPYLLEEGLKGNAEGVDEQELQERAWEQIEPVFAGEQEERRQQFHELKGNQRALVTTDIAATVKAAHYGQVDTLFVPLEIQVWGNFDPETGQVVFDDKQTLKNEDLLDDSAMHTLLNGGKVYAMQPEEIPDNGDVAAILRYMG